MRVRIHQVQLGDGADRPPALGVDGPCELEGVQVGEDSLAGETARMMLMCACVRVCAHEGTCGGWCAGNRKKWETRTPVEFRDVVEDERTYLLNIAHWQLATMESSTNQRENCTEDGDHRDKLVDRQTLVTLGKLTKVRPSTLRLQASSFKRYVLRPVIRAPDLVQFDETLIEEEESRSWYFLSSPSLRV